MKVKFLLALSIGAQCFAQNMDVNKITSRTGMVIMPQKQLSLPP